MACYRIFQISHHMAASLGRNGVASIMTPCSSPASVFNSKLKHLPQAYRNYILYSLSPCKRSTSLKSSLKVPWITLRPIQKSLPRKWTPFTLMFAPLSLFRRKEPHPDHAAEVLAHIPKEVFRKDDLVKKRKKRFFLVRIFIMLWNQLRFIIRFARIVLTFGPLLMAYPLTYTSHSFTVLWWKCLLFAMEHTGPTFVKLGQWASTRRDLFSAEFCELFYKLHSSTKRHSWFMTQRKLRKAFGKRWREIFVKIERKPVGSGCIAQVHRAYMKADMIPDESLIEECLEDLDDADHDEEVDFAEGLEIIGLGRLKDEMDNLMEDVQEATSKRKQQQLSQPQPTKVIESPSLESLEDTQTSGTASKTPQPSDDASSDLTADQSARTDVPSVPSESKDDQEEILIPVAVKVLHPGIYRSFSRDLSILRLLARFLQAVVPSLRWLSLREAVEEFADLMTQQIDLRFEAECLEEFGQNFEDISYIRFPKPVRPYCKRDVIVETFEEGEPIANFLKEDADCPSGLKEQLAIYGVDALLKMIFVDNLVHGDLHPGNILVQNAADFVPPEESMNKLMLLDVCDTVIVNLKHVDNPVRLVLLDVGIATMLSEKDRRNFLDVFTAIVIGEGEKVAELMLNHARYNECTDVEGFKHDLGEVVCRARQETIKLGKIRAGDLLSDVFSILSKYRVKMESNFASILLAIFVLEGLGRSLDPELDLLERAKPTLLSS